MKNEILYCYIIITVLQFPAVMNGEIVLVRVMYVPDQALL